MTGRPASLLRQDVYSHGTDEWQLMADPEAAFDDHVPNSGPLLNAWQYVVKLVPAGSAIRAG